MHAEDLEAHPGGIAGVLEVRRAGQSNIGRLAIQRPQIVADAAAIRAFFPERLGDQLCRIVSERGVRVGSRVESSGEGGYKGTCRGRSIFGSERHSDVRAFSGRRVAENALPAIAANEYRVEALTLRFLQNLEAGCDATSHEDDPRLAGLEIRDVGLRGRQIGVDWIETEDVAVKGAGNESASPRP